MKLHRIFCMISIFLNKITYIFSIRKTGIIESTNCDKNEHTRRKGMSLNEKDSNV